VREVRYDIMRRNRWEVLEKTKKSLEALPLYGYTRTRWRRSSIKCNRV